MKRKRAAKPKKKKKKYVRAPKWVPPAHWLMTPDEWFAARSNHHRPITEALRKLIDEVVPEATWEIKLGFAWCVIDGRMVTAIDLDRRRVNVLFTGPTDCFFELDPDRRLYGDGNHARYLPLTAVDQIPRAQLRVWLRKAVELAAQRAHSMRVAASLRGVPARVRRRPSVLAPSLTPRS